MTGQKLVVELMGKTLLLPIDATIIFTNASFEFYAANFHQRVDKRDIQNLYLLEPEQATPQELALMQKLPQIGDKHVSPKHSPDQDTQKDKTPSPNPKQAEDFDLRSGVI